MLPLANLSPQPKWHLDRFSHLCTAHVRVSSAVVGHAFPLKIAPSRGRIWTPIQYMVLGVHMSPWHLSQLAVFCTAHADCRWACAFPYKLPLHMGIWTPTNKWFLVPIRVHNPNSISISSAIFAGLTTTTGRETTLLRL